MPISNNLNLCLLLYRGRCNMWMDCEIIKLTWHDRHSVKIGTPQHFELVVSVLEDKCCPRMVPTKALMSLYSLSSVMIVLKKLLKLFYCIVWFI